MQLYLLLHAEALNTKTAHIQTFGICYPQKHTRMQWAMCEGHQQEDKLLTSVQQRFSAAIFHPCFSLSSLNEVISFDTCKCLMMTAMNEECILLFKTYNNSWFSICSFSHKGSVTVVIEYCSVFVCLSLFVLCDTEIFPSGSLPAVPEATQLKQHRVEDT